MYLPCREIMSSNGQRALLVGRLHRVQYPSVGGKRPRSQLPRIHSIAVEKGANFSGLHVETVDPVAPPVAAEHGHSTCVRAPPETPHVGNGKRNQPSLARFESPDGQGSSDYAG